MDNRDERIELDPRFLKGVHLFNTGEYLDASEEFEELFFEAVRDEVDFVRVFLQASVGIHHVERGQLRGAIERLQECARVIRRVSDDRGIDISQLERDVRALIPKIESRQGGDQKRIEWPVIRSSGSKRA